ncbi:uncharacterized protein LOC131205509 [Anopheles bellator]|uniref:uncharacterized protein LOC128268644 n=1 Tax=Anopheles cruzii TaxID=68878 RepID=UPI0022EC8CE8|nr:uncharacterized protein LOC128268644 [Anopheles cruzii]XP_058053614.1 uncharacterized protein LOC131205509 [Anopheles bellator]
MEQDIIKCPNSHVFSYLANKMRIDIENPLLQSHRQRETTGIKKLYNSFFVMF